MPGGHIVERNGSFRVMVYVGRDPVTGRKRYVTRTVRGSRKDAERVRNEMLVDVQKGKTSATSTTFGELLDAWYDAASPDWSPRTALEHRRVIDAVLKPALGTKKLAKLRASDLDSLYGALRAGSAERRALAPATVRKFHTVARSALQQAVRWEWITSNPAANASPPKVRRKEPIPPTPDELGRILKAAEAEDPDLYVFVRLAAVLGARRGEVLGIRWGDLTEDCRSVEISSSVVIAKSQIIRKETKTDRVRRVAIDDATAELLEQHRMACQDEAEEFGVDLSPSSYVLSYEPDGSRPWRPDSASRRFTKLRDGLGLNTVRLHDLRHYVATRLISNGVDPKTVANRLGHASPTTTLAIYSHFVPEADREAADLLGNLLDG
jgi:integrase